MSKTRGKPSRLPPQAKNKPLVVEDRNQPGLATVKRQLPLDLAVCLGLLLSILVVYAQVARFDFINFDDDFIVYHNPFVQAGLTLANIQWAMTAVVVANWMPVTLLSHMLDVQLFGLQSGMHHLVNVLFHALSSVLLYLLLRRATRMPWQSAFVAFIFALHPLHVESVAWIAERKDVLSTFFWFLALYAYVRYTEHPTLGRYLLVVIPFCLGLMSKPMLVTFPFTLLLFDIWPLRRIQGDRARWPRMLWEKLPLFALSAAASAVTFTVQRSAGAVQVVYPLATRVENALNSYLIYIVQMFRPARLAVYYSFPESMADWPAAVAFVIILGVSALVIFAWRTRPYYAVGWFWYLGTLVPVIGLVQVGQQSHADRYTYIPLVGLAVILAWGAVDAMQKWPWLKPVCTVAGPVSCVACMLVASAQAAYWRDSGTIFQHAIDTNENGWLVHYNLGYYDMKSLERYVDAIPHFQTALRIRPGSIDTNDCLGFSLMKSGHPAEAVPFFEVVLRAKPDSAEAQVNLGEALAAIPGRDAEAIPHFQAALRLKTPNAETNNDLGACLLNNGRAAEAIPYFEAAVRLKPDSADAHFNLALALSKTPARVPDAISQYEAVLRLKPGYAAAHRNLALLLSGRGRTEDALAHLKLAVSLEPGGYLNQRDLGMLLSTTPGRQSAAIPYLEAAQRIHPEPGVAQTLARLHSGKQ